jgi:maleylpyruvate isomerase
VSYVSAIRPEILAWWRDGEQTLAAAVSALPDADPAGQARLAEAVDRMPDTAWPARVRNAQGRMVPATEVPWMRMRETWVHVVDLAGPVTFADIPGEVTSALVDNIVSGWQARENVAGLTFAATDSGQRSGDGPRVISAPRADLLAWMAGRGIAGAIDFDGPPWPPPPWL